MSPDRDPDAALGPERTQLQNAATRETDLAQREAFTEHVWGFNSDLMTQKKFIFIKLTCR